MPPRPFCQQPFRSQGQPWPRRSGLQSGVFLDSLLFLLHPCPFHQQSLLATLKVTPEHDCCPTSSASAHCHLSGLPVPALPPVWCVLNPVTTVTLPRVCRGGPPPLRTLPSCPLLHEYKQSPSRAWGVRQQPAPRCLSDLHSYHPPCCSPRSATPASCSASDHRPLAVPSTWRCPSDGCVAVPLTSKPLSNGTSWRP